MKYKLPIFIYILLIPFLGLSLTEKSKVSLLTIEPGTEFYTIFGHNAIRIIDKTLEIDKVYNFGTFDFETPFFYFKFLKGDLDYYLSIENYDSLIYNAKLEHRKVIEQLLTLNYSEKVNLFNNLESQYNSDRRSYKYDFFYDNCATRVRDAIIGVKTKPLEYDSLKYSHKTFRQLLQPFISNNYWVNFGVNISLGKEADKIVNSYDFMFLPNYLMEIFNESQVVQENRIIYNPKISNNYHINFTYLSPWIIVSILIFLSITSGYIGLPKLKKRIFYIYTLFVGFTGLLLLAIGIYSNNLAFHSNLNIYWTLPSLIIFLIQKRIVNNVLKVIYITFLALVLITWNQYHQEFSNTFIPWILTLIVILLLDLIRKEKKLLLINRLQTA